MIRKVLLLLSFLLSHLVYAQDNYFKLLKDSTIFIEELSFNSDKEEELFKKVYLDESKDYFSLLYMSSKDAQHSQLEKAKERLNKLIQVFKLKNKSEEKKIKWIYKSVHSEFFKKYVLENHFDDVFENGHYNCLSSSAIYALILEELSIPYQINILPNHVNLMAYPSTHKILIESTDPVEGYFSYDKKFKEKYIERLLAYKIIEPKEIELKSIEEVFDSYFDVSESISLKQLVGAQYYNNALYFIEDESLKEAIEELEKSIALFPSLNSARILLSLYYQEILASSYEEQRHYDYLIKSSRYKEVKQDISDGVHLAFGEIAEKSLLEKGDTIFFKNFYKKLYPLIVDETIKQNLNYIYYAAQGDYYMQNLEFKKASEYYLKTLNVVGDTNDLEDVYVKSIIFQIKDMSDVKKALSILLSAEKSWYSLINNKVFLSAKAEVFSLLMMRSFEQNKIKIGEEYRAKLEDILDNNDITKNENNIGIAYAQAGSAYFRLGSKTKAKILFKKGLKYSPGNYELEYRLNLMGY